MKRYFILILALAVVIAAHAQNRQNIANFSQFQQYFNPALTANSGTVIKNFYREQWSGFEDAPRTLFLSGEANLSDLTKGNADGLQHAFGISILHDTYGALTTNNLALSYGAGVKLSDVFRLGAGISATYNNNSIDEGKLVVDEEGDQAYLSLLNGSNKVNKYGVTLGVALTSDDFYAGYSLTDLIKGGDSDNPYFNDVYVMQHTVQAGYRRAVTGSFGLVLNGIYRYDENLKGTAEGQLKSVFLNTFWVGAGYRNDFAYTFNAGVRFKQFKVNYSYELSSNKVASSYRGGNEITLSYNFTPLLSSGKTLSVW